MEELMSDLMSTIPALEGIMSPEYMPYLNTAGTVLLGWIVVAWTTQILMSLFAPVLVSLLAIVIICPATMQWCLKQLGPNIEDILMQLFERLRSALLSS